MPFDDLCVLDESLQLSNGQLVELLALLLRQFRLLLLVLAGDLVVLVEEDLALVRALVLVVLVDVYDTKLLEDGLVLGEGRVLGWLDEVVYDRAVCVDIGCRRVLLDLKVDRLLVLWLWLFRLFLLILADLLALGLLGVRDANES